jgi:hypothetical protein
MPSRRLLREPSVPTGHPDARRDGGELTACCGCGERANKRPSLSQGMEAQRPLTGRARHGSGDRAIHPYCHRDPLVPGGKKLRVRQTTRAPFSFLAPYPRPTTTLLPRKDFD